MADFAEILSAVKLPEKTLPLCLRGDLVAEWESLERQLQAAQTANADSLAGRGDAHQLAERMQAIRDEMRAHEHVFRFRGKSAQEYSDLQAKHPATPQQREQGLDLNWDTWPTALIAACCVDPAMSEDQAAELRNAVSDAQWDAMYVAALAVNRQVVDVPNSDSVSAILAATAPKQKRRGRGGSAGGASSAGNRNG